MTDHTDNPPTGPEDPTDPAEPADTTADTDTLTNPPPTVPPMPPPVGLPVGPRRLVRDPYSRLGGVLSGLAHYYGFDVSLVRMGFVLFTLFTGIGFVAYPLAWLIIPRADHWPTAPPVPRSRSVKRRDLGLLLAGAGVLLALAIGGSTFGNFLAPVILIGAGVWLLLQPASSPSEPTGTVSAAAEPAPVGDPEAEPLGFSTTPPPPAPVGAPVPPRSRGRRFVILALVLGFFLFIPLLAIGGLVAFIAVGSADFDFDAQQVSLFPATVAELPDHLDYDHGVELVLDLRELSAEDFAAEDGPVSVEIDADYGDIHVIVPDDLVVSVDASSGIGDIDVFDQSSDGFANDVDRPASDPDLELKIDLGIGAVTVSDG